MGVQKESVEDFQGEFLEVMGRERRLRKYLRTLNSEAIERVIIRLKKIKAEHESEEMDLLQKEEDRKNEVLQFKKLMKAKGISEKELFDSTSTLHKPKYIYKDETGKKHQWSGKGKVPKVFVELIKSGVNIDETCLARDLK